MKHLLDVNVLLAAVWENHPHHGKAIAWLADKELSLCPISELGFLRVSSHPKAIGAPMGRAREALQRFATQAKVERIPDDLPALESHPRTSNEVTDHYLADLAAKHGLKLATFDAKLTHGASELIA
jgi:toxin-antitoxin system PIN domain toxin